MILQFWKLRSIPAEEDAFFDRLPLSSLHVLDVEEEDEEEHAGDRGGHLCSDFMPDWRQNEATTRPATVDADDGAASTEPRSKSLAQAVAEAVGLTHEEQQIRQAADARVCVCTCTWS
eukprot:s6176_g8.t1